MIKNGFHICLIYYYGLNFISADKEQGRDILFLHMILY